MHAEPHGRPRLRRVLIPALAGVASLLAGTGIASAADVGTVTYAGGTLTVTADASVATNTTWYVYVDDVAVEFSAQGGSMFALATSVTGCDVIAGANVKCTILSMSAAPTRIAVDLGAAIGAQGAQILDKTRSTPLPATITGGAGNDTLIGGQFDDTINGGGGADLIAGRRGADAINGGPGADTANYMTESAQPDGPSFETSVAGRNAGVSVTLDGIANDGAAGYDGVTASDNVGATTENVLGTEFDDTLRGDDAANLLDGKSGDDAIYGGAGADGMLGSLGDDTIDARDGEKDTEINCFNSKIAASDGQQNVARWDKGVDDRPTNCQTLDPAADSADDAGDDGGGSGTYDQTQFTPLPLHRGVWVVPARLAPKAKGAGFQFSELTDVMLAARTAEFPIVVDVKYVGPSGTPAKYRAAANHDDIVRMLPVPGDEIRGTTGRPGELTVFVYSELKEPLPGACPYQTVAKILDGVAVSDALKKIKQEKCAYRMGKSIRSRVVETQTVKSAKIARKGPGSFELVLNVLNPSTSPPLSIMLMPNDPLKISVDPVFGEKTGNLTFDQNGELRVSATDKTTIDVQGWGNVAGFPIIGAKVTIFGVDGHEVKTATVGGKSISALLTFATPQPGKMRVLVSATDESGYSIEGERMITVIRDRKPFVTIDGRCINPKGTGTDWEVVACGATSPYLARSGPNGRAGPDARWDLIDPDLANAVLRLLQDENIHGGRSRQRVADLCGPIACDDTQVIQLMREYRIVPSSFGVNGTTSSGAFEDPAEVSFKKALVWDASRGQYIEGFVPAAKINVPKGVLALYMNGSLFFTPRSATSPLIGLDAGTLINLDGGSLLNDVASMYGLDPASLRDAALAAAKRATLINLDGGSIVGLNGATLSNGRAAQIVGLNGATLLNLDGGTLINVDAGTMIRSMPGMTPPALVDGDGMMATFIP